MNHTQRLTLCEVCRNKDFSSKLGVVCTLTSDRPAFEGTCKDFDNDPKMVARKQREEESRMNLSDGGGGDIVEVGGEASPWRIIIAIVVVLLVLMRLLIRCDRVMN